MDRIERASFLLEKEVRQQLVRIRVADEGTPAVFSAFRYKARGPKAVGRTSDRDSSNYKMRFTLDFSQTDCNRTMLADVDRTWKVQVPERLRTTWVPERLHTTWVPERLRRTWAPLHRESFHTKPAAAAVANWVVEEALQQVPKSSNSHCKLNRHR